MDLDEQVRSADEKQAAMFHVQCNFIREQMKTWSTKKSQHVGLEVSNANTEVTTCCERPKPSSDVGNDVFVGSTLHAASDVEKNACLMRQNQIGQDLEEVRCRCEGLMHQQADIKDQFTGVTQQLHSMERRFKDLRDIESKGQREVDQRALAELQRAVIATRGSIDAVTQSLEARITKVCEGLRSENMEFQANMRECLTLKGDEMSSVMQEVRELMRIESRDRCTSHETLALQVHDIAGTLDRERKEQEKEFSALHAQLQDYRRDVDSLLPERHIIELRGMLKDEAKQHTENQLAFVHSRLEVEARERALITGRLELLSSAFDTALEGLRSEAIEFQANMRECLALKGEEMFSVMQDVRELMRVESRDRCTCYETLALQIQGIVGTLDRERQDHGKAFSTFHAQLQECRRDVDSLHPEKDIIEFRRMVKNEARTHIENELAFVNSRFEVEARERALITGRLELLSSAFDEALEHRADSVGALEISSRILSESQAVDRVHCDEEFARIRADFKTETECVESRIRQDIDEKIKAEMRRGDIAFDQSVDIVVQGEEVSSVMQEVRELLGVESRDRCTSHEALALQIQDILGTLDRERQEHEKAFSTLHAQLRECRHELECVQQMQSILELWAMMEDETKKRAEADLAHTSALMCMQDRLEAESHDRARGIADVVGKLELLAPAIDTEVKARIDSIGELEVTCRSLLDQECKARASEQAHYDQELACMRRDWSSILRDTAPSEHNIDELKQRIEVGIEKVRDALSQQKSQHQANIQECVKLNTEELARIKCESREILERESHERCSSHAALGLQLQHLAATLDEERSARESAIAALLSQLRECRRDIDYLHPGQSINAIREMVKDEANQSTERRSARLHSRLEVEARERALIAGRLDLLSSAFDKPTEAIAHEQETRFLIEGEIKARDADRACCDQELARARADFKAETQPRHEADQRILADLQSQHADMIRDQIIDAVVQKMEARIVGVGEVIRRENVECLTLKSEEISRKLHDSIELVIHESRELQRTVAAFDEERSEIDRVLTSLRVQLRTCKQEVDSSSPEQHIVQLRGTSRDGAPQHTHSHLIYMQSCRELESRERALIAENLEMLSSAIDKAAEDLAERVSALENASRTLIEEETESRAADRAYYDQEFVSIRADLEAEVVRRRAESICTGKDICAALKQIAESVGHGMREESSYELACSGPSDSEVCQQPSMSDTAMEILMEFDKLLVSRIR